MSHIVWLASYPKSGNTWTRLLIASVHEDGGAVDINDIDGPLMHAASRPLFDETLCVEASELSLDLIDEMRPKVYEALAADALESVYLKVHDIYGMTPAGTPMFPAAATAAVIYIVRDPRDLVASYAAHFGASIEYAIASLNNKDLVLAHTDTRLAKQLPQRLSSWSDHVESWLGSSLPLYLLRYEDLLADPVGTFVKVVDFLGLDKPVEVIERAVAATRFEVLASQEKEKGFREQVAQQEAFFRRGIAGGWRDELTPEQAARIEEAHGPMMRRLGYL